MIGRVKYGSYKDGLIVQLNADHSIEDFRIGEFVKIEGKNLDFIGMITDLKLNIINPDVFISPPENNDYLKYAINGTMINSEVEFYPLVSIDRTQNTIHSVKSIPAQFDEMIPVSQNDLDTILMSGIKKEDKPFQIGNILTMDYYANINLNNIIERSLGVFGSTGSGKTFFTRLLLAGLIKNDVCSNLVFDFHEEYGIKGSSEEIESVPGLAHLFGNKVFIYTVEPKGLSKEKFIQIPLSDIEPEDLNLIKKELRLSDLSYETALSVRRIEGKHWIEELLKLNPDNIDKEKINEWNVHPESLNALIRHIQVFNDLNFLRSGETDSCIKEIIEFLKKGINVIIQFNNTKHQRLSYLLISSILTRRIYNTYRKIAEEGKKLKHLLITIEEAHNFLSPEISAETIFGEIARELRKFYVTLLIVDQIPSQIDTEVLSQLGSRILFHLNSDKDLESSLEGLQGRNKLKQVVYSLDNKGEALISGYAVAIPFAFKVRRYDEEFFKEMKKNDFDSDEIDPGKILYGQ
jgi:uncharacterized protein